MKILILLLVLSQNGNCARMVKDIEIERIGSRHYLGPFLGTWGKIPEETPGLLDLRSSVVIDDFDIRPDLKRKPKPYDIKTLRVAGEEHATPGANLKQILAHTGNGHAPDDALGQLVDIVKAYAGQFNISTEQELVLSQQVPIHPAVKIAV